MSIRNSLPWSYEHPHPAVATDVAIFTVRAGSLWLLLIQRGGEPFKGMWALPGGFLLPDEDIEACARRELLEESGGEAQGREQVGIFSDPKRDPRERVISIAYLTLVREDQVSPMAGSDASHVDWHEISDLPPLAFDHAEIIEKACEKLRSRIDDLLLNLMPARFTMRQLIEAQETVAGRKVDRRNFNKTWINSGLLLPTGEEERGAHRPARYFTRASRG